MAQRVQMKGTVAAQLRIIKAQAVQTKWKLSESKATVAAQLRIVLALTVQTKRKVKGKITTDTTRASKVRVESAKKWTKCIILATCSAENFGQINFAERMISVQVFLEATLH